jgi:hypothetical protein
MTIVLFVYETKYLFFMLSLKKGVIKVLYIIVQFVDFFLFARIHLSHFGSLPVHDLIHSFHTRKVSTIRRTSIFDSFLSDMY